MGMARTALSVPFPPQSQDATDILLKALPESKPPAYRTDTQDSGGY